MRPSHRVGAVYAAILLACVATPNALKAHALGAYMQATYLSLSQSDLQLELVLSPGLAVSEGVIRHIDTDSDGVFSLAEQSTYIREVIRDLTWSLNGRSLPLSLTSSSWPTTGQVREGTGRLVLQFRVPAPRFREGIQHLSVENRHTPVESAYLVNSFATPAGVRIISQHRDWNQKGLVLEFTTANLTHGAVQPAVPRRMTPWQVALLTLAAFVGLSKCWRWRSIGGRRAFGSGTPRGN